MKEKKSFAQSLDAFFNGKGFYIVLFACAAVIGVSVWSLLVSDKQSLSGDAQMVQAGVGSEDGLSAFVGGDVDAGAFYGDSEAPAVRETAAPKPSEQPKPSAAAPSKQPEPSATPSEEPEPSANTEKLVFVWPTPGGISAAYSVDYPVYNKTMADWRTHDGVDIETELGTRVLAVANGIVTDVYGDEMYGTTIVIDHGDGLESVYSNLAETPVVSEGDAVTTAAVIGSVGDTALAEAAEPAHLHFGMTLNGESVDPAAYLPAK